MKRKLLMLGGADIQVVAIKRAIGMGFEVITCDYLPDNPGHQVSHAYHNVSTTDKEAVLALAQRLGIHGISAYGSDPAAVTAAYVSEKLVLPGNSYAAIARVQDKILFREAQHAAGIPAPRAAQAVSAEQIKALVDSWPLGGMIKPVDSSGSKGVFKVAPGTSADTVRVLLARSLSFSRAGRVIIEELLVRQGPMITGDVLIVAGKVAFYCFGDVHFNDRLNGLVPRAVSVPATVDANTQSLAMEHLQRFIDHLGIREGVFNVDVLVDPELGPVMIDIGARNGGNMVDDLYCLRTGVDLTDASIRLSMGEPVDFKVRHDPTRFVTHCVIHSLMAGTLEKVHFSPELEQAIFHRIDQVLPGQRVEPFTSSAYRIGLLLLSFPSHEAMAAVLGDIYRHMIVEVRA